MLFCGLFCNILLWFKYNLCVHGRCVNTMGETTGVRVQTLLWVALFTALTAVGSVIRIPTPPVPFTLQTLFVYLAGDILGSKKGAASQVLFLALGLMGVPVFSMGGGPAYVLQPTFGYLVGFPAGAWIVGTVVEKLGGPARWWKWIVANGAGLFVILVMGVVYLYININFVVHKDLSWVRALWSGVLIFLPGEVVKVILAAGLARRLRPLMVRG